MIKVEMAVVIDVTKPLREATYTLEGDGPLALITADIINRTALSLNLSQHSMDYPNVQRVIKEAVDEDLRPAYVFEQNYEFPKDCWVEYCKIISKECVDYFMVNVVQHPCIPLYNAACIANPNTMRKMILKGDSSAERIREIIAPLSPKLLSSSLINKMINELAEYQIQSNECLWSDLKDDIMLENIVEFWSERKSLPAWREFAHLCYLLQPTSASVERAFSILK